MTAQTKITGARIRQEPVRVKRGNKTHEYVRYIVDLGVVDGKRVRRSFKTEAEAQEHVDDVLGRRKKIGEDAKKLSKAILKQAAEAVDILCGKATLTDAARFFIDHHSPDGGSQTARQAFEAYLQARKDANRRPHTLRNIRHRLGAFADDFGDRPVHEITTHDLERWISGKGGTPTNRKNNRVHLVGLFNFALKRKWVRENPASVLETPTVKKAKPYVLSVGDAGSLMASAEAHAPEMVPYFALCTFAGIRPEECQRLDWKDIDLGRREIFIEADISKTHEDRWIEINDNLLAWLSTYHQGDDTVLFSRSKFEAVRKKAGIGWKSDCMRHSYGSYHLAAFENAGKTALQMGHKQLGTLFEHYRRAVRKEDAERFWAIRPSKQAAAIRFPAQQAG